MRLDELADKITKQIVPRNSIKIAISCGTTIDKACADTIKLAKKSKKTYVFDFNGVQMIVGPKDTIKSLLAYWNQKLAQNCEDYEKSPAGQKAKLEAQIRLKQSQQETDTLLAKVPAAIHNDDQLLEILVGLSESADNIGIEWNPKALAEQIIHNSPHRPNQFVGLPKDAYDQAASRNYMIGQALDCLLRGMCPHPILQRFYKEWQEAKPQVKPQVEPQMHHTESNARILEL